MRGFLFLLAAAAVISSGYWAYYENYRTKAELDHVDDLRREIGAARERIAILRAEWAYLNRPDRLRDLAELNFDRLGLLPFTPDQFGRIDQVSYPRSEILDLTQPVDVTSAGATNP
ncbi:cell division protein FtsL [Mameliella sediminis]|uniref:cell division protein FtsL n=1 Tax=Mameliella sediminis TaxID=2836866 RepID=UPI001C4600B4|nr:cell division protein FtsL [Mameliella sediminis]MBV7397061.1 cell division protein FtsL [Mameliella sediminis]